MWSTWVSQRSTPWTDDEIVIVKALTSLNLGRSGGLSGGVVFISFFFSLFFSPSSFAPCCTWASEGGGGEPGRRSWALVSNMAVVLNLFLSKHWWLTAVCNSLSFFFGRWVLAENFAPEPLKAMAVNLGVGLKYGCGCGPEPLKALTVDFSLTFSLLLHLDGEPMPLKA